MLTRFGVFPAIFDLLSAFGEFTSPVNESMGCCQVLSHPNSAVTGETAPKVLPIAIAKCHRNLLFGEAY